MIAKLEGHPQTGGHRIRLVETHQIPEDTKCYFSTVVERQTE